MPAREIVQSIDWTDFRKRVRSSVLSALSRYSQPELDSGVRPPIFQISICTDAQSLETEISINSLERAQESIRQLISFLRSKKGWAVAAAADVQLLRPYSNNPADFLYPRFEIVEHPELMAIRQVDLRDPSQRAVVEGMIEVHLLDLADRLETEGVFRRIQRETQVWIGISSPRDWYDHVRAV